MTALLVEAAALTDTGQRRSHNEDFVEFFVPTDPQMASADGSLFVVADGVGGAAAGEVVSQYAVKKVLYEYYANGLFSPEDRLRQAIQAANDDVLEFVRSQEGQRTMATTIVALAIRDTGFTIANLGDSRAYLIRNGDIEQMTRDQTFVARLVEEGVITKEEAKTHPKRSVLMRSLGTERKARMEFTTGTVQHDDYFLLCSDGLTGYITDKELLTLTEGRELREAASVLVNLANQRGGQDNITALIVRVERPPEYGAIADDETAVDAVAIDEPDLDTIHRTATNRNVISED